MRSIQEGSAPVAESRSATMVDARELAGPEVTGVLSTLRQRTAEVRSELAPLVGDPMATGSRAAYVAWLRRLVGAWSQLDLVIPAVPPATWPLSSVRPSCLDAVGLILADLRELSPGTTRMSLIPRPSRPGDEVTEPTWIGAVFACVSVSRLAAGLLEEAHGLTAASGHGPATRYLQRCARVTEQAAGMEREIEQWAQTATAPDVEQATRSAERTLDQLLAGLVARRRTGW